jgi:hypothetical protein
VAARLQGLLPSSRAGVAGQTEALHIMRRLKKEYPDTRGNPVTNLSLLTAIKTLGLSYNKAVDLRWWILDQVITKKTDLSTIPPMSKVFRQVESVMLPEGVVVEEEAALVPVQSLLDHTTCR